MHQVHIDHRSSLIKENMARIKRKLLVMSNKGGVGKSTVAVSFAALLAAHLPLERVVVRRLDAQRALIETVADGLSGAGPAFEPARNACTTRWGGNSALCHRSRAFDCAKRYAV